MFERRLSSAVESLIAAYPLGRAAGEAHATHALRTLALRYEAERSDRETEPR